MDKETRSHDLALAYMDYKLRIERENSDAEHDEQEFFVMYRAAFHNFYELLP